MGHLFFIESEDQDQHLNFSKHSYLVGGDLICFSKALSVDDKKAILESMLFGQLASNYKYRSQGGETYSASAWLKYYGEILNNLGWASTNFTSFDPVLSYVIDPHTSYVREIGKIAIGEISTHIKSDEFTADLSAVFDAVLKGGKASKLLHSLTEAHTNVRNNSFLVAIADISQSVPFVLFLAIEINIDISKIQELMSHVDKFDMKVAAVGVRINRVMFNHIKAEIEEKLGKRLETDVLPIF